MVVFQPAPARALPAWLCVGLAGASPSRTFGLAVLALLAVPLALLGVRPKVWYRVGEGVLELPTLLSTRQYRLAGARAAAVLRSRFALRVAGTALPGYYAGWFWMWGKFTRVWATRLDSGVRIDFADGGCIFVTPADAPAFLVALGAAGATIVPQALTE